jgi:hypothetical protein
MYSKGASGFPGDSLMHYREPQQTNKEHGCGNRNNERPGFCGALVVAIWLVSFWQNSFHKSYNFVFIARILLTKNESV